MSHTTQKVLFYKDFRLLQKPSLIIYLATQSYVFYFKPLFINHLSSMNRPKIISKNLFIAIRAQLLNCQE